MFTVKRLFSSGVFGLIGLNITQDFRKLATVNKVNKNTKEFY